MAGPTAMKRKRDGRIQPYSSVLVAAHPGDYVEVRWDGKAWQEAGPLVPPPPEPAAAIEIDPRDGVEKPAPERVEVEPETAAAPARKAKAKVAKGAGT